MKPLDLVEVARASLSSSSRGKPSQACLRRATSTAYYAVFHCLAREGADLLIGGFSANRSKPAWIQTYRALDHTSAEKACGKSNVVSKFPKGIEDFANAFRTLQKKRHSADYDPLVSFSKSGVQADIDLAELAIKTFKTEKLADRRAFCAWVLFRPPRVS